MGKNKSSVRLKIIISFILLMLTTSGVISYIVFSNWKLSVNDVITKLESDAHRDILNKIEAFVSVPFYINEVNQSLIKNEIVDISNELQREVFFVGVMQANDEGVYSFSYGTKNGEYFGARRNPQNELEIMKSNAETDGKSTYYAVTERMTSGKVVEQLGKFDPRTREWYKIAQTERKPMFSAVYEHFVMKDLALSASYPIFAEDGNLKGVLGTHFTLSRINSYLEEIVKDKHALAYIVESDSGMLVANSQGMPNFATLDDGSLKRISIEEINTPYIQDAYLEHKRNPANQHQIMKTSEDKYHINFSNYQKNGIDWMIITALPESQFTAEITTNIWLAIILSSITLIISLLLYLKSTEIIFKPISNLISVTEKYSQGDFSERAKIFRNDEMGKLSAAFNKMAEQLQFLINTLEQRVTRRTTDLETANTALKESEEKIRLILNSAAEAIFGVDLQGNCTFCNSSCLKMLGYTKPEDLLGKNMHKLIHHHQADGTPYPANECKIYDTLVTGKPTQTDTEVFWRNDGTNFQVEYYSYPQYLNGEIIGAVITFLDITERKKAEKEIIYLSYHDQLTGLYNRRYYEDALKRLDVPEYYPLTIVMADMNGLKLINDSLGHAMGDELIKKVAQVLRNGCRAGDIIARVGGDEFIILLPRTSSQETAQIIKYLQQLASKEQVGSVDISISFGYETKSNQGEEIQEILKKAEDQMYKKKLFEGPSMRGKTIDTIISTLHEKNPREEAHSHRVSLLCESMGIALGLPASKVKELKTVGLLHDIGKIAVEENILNKQGTLTTAEWEQVKRHPETGYRILSTVNNMSEMAEYVLAHHERWDGYGYPKGLKGAEIPLLSRVITIADAYDAMTSHRSYRSALPAETATEELRRKSGTQFDPELIEIFIEKVVNNPFSNLPARSNQKPAQ